MGSPTEPLEGEIEPLKYTTLELPVEDFAISQINATPDCSIEVIGVNEEFKSVDAFCGIPVDPGIPQEYVAVSLATDPHYTGQHDGVIQIIGSQDGTSVDIVLSVDAAIVGGKNASYYERDKTHSIIMDKYETLTITSVGDLTGTRIISSSGLSVFSGHECRFTESDADCRVGECDILVEQLPPTSVWGTEYILSPFLGRTTGSRIKVVAARANTVINIQCYSMNHDKTVPDKVVTIGSGESYHFILQRSSYCRVSSNQPILVAQFSMARENEDIGAPFMLLVPDVDKSLRNVSFISIDTTDHRFHHFVTVVIKGGYLDTPVMIDGSPTVLEDASHQVLDFGSNKTYLVIRMSVGEGYHHLQHGMFGRVFGLMVYGFTRDASYGYSMGYHQGMVSNVLRYWFQCIYTRTVTYHTCILVYI